MSGKALEEIEGLLAQKLTACEAFLSSTGELHKALESDDGEETDRLIARRAGLIAVVETLDRRIERCAQAIQAERQPLPPPRLEALLARIATTLGAAIRENGRCAAAAGRRREALREAMEAMERARTGLQGYGDAGQRGPRFLNLQT